MDCAFNTPKDSTVLTGSLTVRFCFETLGCYPAIHWHKIHTSPIPHSNSFQKQEEEVVCIMTVLQSSNCYLCDSLELSGGEFQAAAAAATGPSALWQASRRLADGRSLQLTRSGHR